MLKLLFVSVISCIGVYLTAQTCHIKGVLKDKVSNETIIGATIIVSGTALGTTSDFDGNFELKGVPQGNRELVVSYVGYKKITKLLDLKGGEFLQEEFLLEEESTVLADVVVVGKINKQNAIAITMLQQKSPGMLTGISNDDIKKAPDKTTSDVLKRVSGASIVDQKFVIIRGLADRYNNALLNGNLLPSTEPDKRSFSFDLFPSSVLSNLVIYKTATPDLPGEFAGGIIQVNTKEVSEDPFIELTMGASYNSISTFKPYNFYVGGTTDWMGFDNRKRTLDERVTKAALNDPQTKYTTSKYVANDWIVKNYTSFMPSQNIQLSGGKTTRLFGNRFGIIGALTYQNTNKIVDYSRSDFNTDKTAIFNYVDHLYKKSFNHGGMLNATYSFSPKHKISFNNLATILGDDQYLEREGHEIEQARLIKAYSMYYTSTSMINNQLTGEHEMSSNGSLLKWSIAHALVNKLTPSYRRMTYLKNDYGTPDEPYFAYIPIGTPSPNYAGRFYSEQNEKFYTGRIDFIYPFGVEKKSQFKLGVCGDFKDRSFDGRVFGYTYAKNSVPQELLTQDIQEILDHKNINENGFVLKESTNTNDSYTASGTGAAGYAMIDKFLFSDKLRVIGGVRVESFNQKLNSFDYGGKKITLDETYVDLLPSVNVVYSIAEQTNIRISGAQTIIRPNFRELAPFSFYDFTLSAAIVGNPELQRTKVLNLDLKFEKFFNGGQTYSISAFYKRFKNPVEQIYETLGAGTKNFNFKNAKLAENDGLETEIRYDLGKLVSAIEGLQFRANAAWIYSNVDLSDFAGQNASKRSLQSQSPYLINLALSYQSLKSGFGASILYNSIGRRIWLVGSNGYLDTYEAPRNLLDLQITQKIGKKLQFKFSISDILNEPFRFYQDQNDSGNYDINDTVILESKAGINYSVALNLMLN
ncbi:MAG: carboxypeptidase-like regulatory domain-containing protein [Saprospiraceae bacterium]|nr:carboxypeptidase-like regulatory domain-containing protein [Saprospiraceae bacterium]